MNNDTKLWLWKNGDHFLAFESEYPCFTPGGDPMTLGNPAGTAVFKTSFDGASRSRAASEPGEVARLAEEARRTADTARHDLLMAIYERHDVAATFFAFDRLAVGKDRDAARNALCEYDRALQMKIDNLMALSALAATATSPASEAQAGWVMVPREPTPEMLAAIPWPTSVTPRFGVECYRAMLASAPLPASSPVAAEGQKAVAPVKAVAEFNNGSWHLRLGMVWMTAPNPPVGPQMVSEEYRVKMYAARINAEIDGGVAAFGCDVEARGTSYSDGDKIRRCSNWCGLERCAVSLKCATPTASMADAAEAVPLRDPRMEKFDRCGPLPGMIAAFEAHYGQSWTDKDWRDETSTWAAAWSRASATPGPRGENAGGVVEALSEQAVEDLHREVLWVPREAHIWSFATAIQRAFAEANGLRIAEKGDAS